MRCEGMKATLPSILVLLATLAFGTGCGASAYSATGGSHFELDHGKEVDDEDILKAFQAAPQLGESSRVAFYTFDDKKAPDVERMLGAVPHVKSTYHIPALLVSGTRRYQEQTASGEVSVKKLRLLAARAGADVLVIVDYGYRGGGANGLSALNLLLVPALFVPFLDNRTESYAQAWVLDVRNGYFYGDASADAKSGSAFVNIYADGPDALFAADWPKLLSTLQTKLTDRLAPSKPKAPEARAATAPAATAPATIATSVDATKPVPAAAP